MPTAPQSFGQRHKRQKDKARGTPTQRGYDSHWYRISRAYRQAHPVCEICHDAAAQDVDHIVPFTGLNDPLRTAHSNLQAVCRACHNAKTRRQG